MFRLALALALLVPVLPARADERREDPSCSEDPAPGDRIELSLLGRLQVRCRPPLQGYASLGFRSAIDTVVDDTAESATSAAIDLTGEGAVNFASGAQLRTAGDATLGTGPSAAPSGGGELAVASPPGLLASELSQRVDLQRLPGLFASRVRTPGQRYDEIATALRTSIASAESGGVRGVIVPVTVERVATSTDDLDATRWSLRVALASAGRNGTTADFLDFRSDWALGTSLHHVDLFDVRVDEPNLRGRFRLGAADRDPTEGGDSASSLHYDNYEGEFSSYARRADGGYWAGFGIRSEFSLTTDGKLLREHRFTTEIVTPCLGGWFGASMFLARSHLGEVDTPEMPTSSAWTFGARTSYTRELGSFDLAAVAAAGHTFHRRVGEAVYVEPGFAATASLAITAAAGTRPTRNRMPD